jgi:peptidyl-dipeptidase A
MMLDRVVGDPRFAEALGLIDAATRERVAPEAQAYLTFAPLQFSRWTQVMLRFERELYRDPSQDLNARWWSLVEQYRGLKRPLERNAPDYASKIHITVAPVYYHNYMLGELFGAQVHEAIARAVGSEAKAEVYVGKPAVGTFLTEKVFRPGSRWSFKDLTEHATGSPLSAAAFARRFQP